jgi:hypothetical protein
MYENYNLSSFVSWYNAFPFCNICALYIWFWPGCKSLLFFYWKCSPGIVQNAYQNVGWTICQILTGCKWQSCEATRKKIKITMDGAVIGLSQERRPVTPRVWYGPRSWWGFRRTTFQRMRNPRPSSAGVVSSRSRRRGLDAPSAVFQLIFCPGAIGKAKRGPPTTHLSGYCRRPGARDRILLRKNLRQITVRVQEIRPTCQQARPLHRNQEWSP